jgi:hypothetical protein
LRGVRKKGDIVENIVGLIDEESKTTDFLEACQKKFSKIELEWVGKKKVEGKKKKESFTFTKTISIANLQKLKFSWIEPEVDERPAGEPQKEPEDDNPKFRKIK